MIFYLKLNKTDFSDYADDNALFVTYDSADGIIKSLENYSLKLFKRFADKQMKINKEKCHLLVGTDESKIINVDRNTIKEK